MMGWPLLPSSQGVLGRVSVAEARCGLETVMDSGRAFCEQRHDLRKYKGLLLVRSLRLNTGLKKLQKYSAGRRILNYILGVWKGDENPVSRV